jgi:hypothetical protein
VTDFATQSDLLARLGLDAWVGNEQARATTLLAQAQDLVRQSAKQTITKVTGDVWTTRGVFGNRLLVPERPVIQVTQVQAQFMNGTTYTVDPAHLLRRPRRARPVRLAAQLHDRERLARPGLEAHRHVRPRLRPGRQPRPAPARAGQDGRARGRGALLGQPRGRVAWR